MNYEEAEARFESFGTFCDDYNEACDGDCEKCSDMEDRIIEALAMQNNIVHCKDCQNWKTTTIETLDGRTTKAGQCELTKWLCGEQGYCMYGREVEDEID